MFIRYLIYARPHSQYFDILTHLDFTVTPQGRPYYYHILQVRKLKYRKASNLL